MRKKVWQRVYIHEIYYLSGDSCRCFFCCFSFLIGSMQCKSRIYIINHINLIALQSIAVLNMQLSPIVLGSFMSLLACLPACLLQKSIKSFDSAACKVWEQSVSFTFLIFSFIFFFACSGLRQLLSLHIGLRLQLRRQRRLRLRLRQRRQLVGRGLRSTL